MVEPFWGAGEAKPRDSKIMTSPEIINDAAMKLPKVVDLSLRNLSQVPDLVQGGELSLTLLYAALMDKNQDTDSRYAPD